MSTTLVPHYQRDINYGHPKSKGWVQVKSERYVFLSIDFVPYILCRDTGWYSVCFDERQHTIHHDAVIKLMLKREGKIGPRSAQQQLVMTAAELALEGESAAAAAVFKKALGK